MNIRATNETHDPALRSWIAAANLDGTSFPIQNLPLGIFRRAGASEAFRGGVAIGDRVLDLAALFEAEIFWGDARDALAFARLATLNAFMALGHDASHALRAALSRALAEGSPVRERLVPMLVPLADAEVALPTTIGDYTDFYSSIHHATAVGKLFRPEEPLLPNYAWVPIGYHGRASSVVISGTPIAWPSGQRLPRGKSVPAFEPSVRLDYEAELGFFVGRGNALGTPIPISRAEEHLFGVCLLNDWSARDIQGWEYQPLGPFLAKSFATTISPWVVTLEALAPFRSAWAVREPPVLAYLAEREPATATFDIAVTAALETPNMRESDLAPHTFAHASYAEAYWTPGQLVAHHTSNGCNLRPGDLLGSGTISGARPEQAGSLLERSVAGSRPITLVSGEERRFLAPSDAVVLGATCARAPYRSIGFGEASGIVG